MLRKKVISVGVMVILYEKTLISSGTIFHIPFLSPKGQWKFQKIFSESNISLLPPYILAPTLQIIIRKNSPELFKGLYDSTKGRRSI